MTAQISDMLIHEGVEWAIGAQAGEGMFDPAAHGLEPYPGSSACWSGYICIYEIASSLLQLKEFMAFQKAPRPKLFGQSPSVGEHVAGFDTHYMDLHARVNFTGSLLMGDHFIQRYYRHMGFHPSWKYEHVKEVVVDQGEVKEVVDRSQLMAELRKRMDAHDGDFLAPEEIDTLEQWLNSELVGDYPLAM